MWAFYYLKNEFGFEDAIRDIISRGGETSINASIVGGLLGAALGLEHGLNLDKVDQVLKFQNDWSGETKDNYRQIPEFCIPGRSQLV